MKAKSSVLLLTLLVVSACSSKPVLYPNGKLKTTGKTRADLDVKRCMSESEEYMKSSKAKQIAKSGGFGAFVGGSVGVIKGLITGDVLQSAAEGAAYGGAGGAAAGSISPDQLKRSYVNHCLAKKGYRVLGWD